MTLTTASFSGIQILRNDALPPRTMVVSPDVFEQLKQAVPPQPCQQPQAHPARCGCEQVKP